jgi:hypothetical protein
MDDHGVVASGGEWRLGQRAPTCGPVGMIGAAQIVAQSRICCGEEPRPARRGY